MGAAAAPALLASGQTAATGPRSPFLFSASVPVAVSGEIVREIDDPHTGDRWLLLRDSSHPGGPGRMVLVANVRNETRPNELEAGALRPVIRAGDRLIVEEDTAVVAARLEAVALGPAVIGSPFEARLKIGGRVVRALALAPGRAAFQAETEVRR